MVNWLCNLQSKLGLIDWVDEHQGLHRGWQAEVQWGVVGEIGYDRYVLAMDRLHPHRARIEEAIFARTTNLLSLPLRLCFDVPGFSGGEFRRATLGNFGERHQPFSLPMISGLRANLMRRRGFAQAR